MAQHSAGEPSSAPSSTQKQLLGFWVAELLGTHSSPKTRSSFGRAQCSNFAIQYFTAPLGISAKAVMIAPF